jgi:flagella basal body P-ring formation protein FlgA
MPVPEKMLTPGLVLTRIRKQMLRLQLRSLRLPHCLLLPVFLGLCGLVAAPHRAAAGEAALPYRSLRIAHMVEQDGAKSAKSAKGIVATQWLKGAAISDAAQRHLVADLSRQFSAVESKPDALLADIEVPMGQVIFRPRPLDSARAGSRQSVWIDVLVDGTFCRTLVVPFQVRMQQRVQVAIRDLPTGTLVSNEDFEARTMDVSDSARRLLPASDFQGTMRLATRVGAGEVVQLHQLINETTLLRGDPVKLVLAAGGVTVETRAVAQQAAVLGQEVKVKPDTSRETVSGRVVAAGVVQAAAW